MAFGGTAFAQDRDDHRSDDHKSDRQQTAPQQKQTPQIGGRYGHGYNPGAAAQAPQAQPAPSNNSRGQNPNNVAREPGRDRNNGRGEPDFAMRGPNNMQGPDRAMRGPGERRDFSSYHRNFDAPRRFRVGFYRRPAGWYPHHWVFGEILPALFWAPDFWLTDYYDFGLLPPPPGTIWVRDGEDALLIDRYSGEIIQVAYGVFY
jgi:Ni/Co efflux regulator RcnB